MFGIILGIWDLKMFSKMFFTNIKKLLVHESTPLTITTYMYNVGTHGQVVNVEDLWPKGHGFDPYWAVWYVLGQEISFHIASIYSVVD